jgi:sulfur-carrier protein
MRTAVEVEVRLFATLREGRFARKTLALPEDSRVSDLIERLDLPRQQVAILLVNGRNAPPEHALHSGDTVSMFPLLAGG